LLETNVYVKVSSAVTAITPTQKLAYLLLVSR